MKLSPLRSSHQLTSHAGGVSAKTESDNDLINGILLQKPAHSWIEEFWFRVGEPDTNPRLRNIETYRLRTDVPPLEHVSRLEQGRLPRIILANKHIDRRRELKTSSPEAANIVKLESC